jgi:NADPH:quinone reductase-like Zn-dependent oxidoreductase
MKAVVCTKYGKPEVLEIKEIDKPSPKDNEILVKIYATTVTIADCRVRGFNVPVSFWLPARIALGFKRPRKPILGMELSGVVESVGNKVSLFKKGDRIFGNTGHSVFGAYAEYCCIAESACIALKPEDISFEEAAAITFGGITALQFLRKGNIKQGEKVLIYGASGSVGTYAVQLAKYFGAEVTGVCSTGNLTMVKSLGADKVIDYTATDFSKTDEMYDVIFDTVGKASISGIIKSLKPTGKYIHAVTTPATEIKIRLRLLNSKKKLIGGTFIPNNEQIDFLRKLVEQGTIKPVIDRIYPFYQIIDAHKYVDLGHKKGNVVITMK